MSIFIKKAPKVEEFLREPAYEATGYTDNVVDQTVTEDSTWSWVEGDADSAVILRRTVEYNADLVKLTSTVWDVVNAPTIATITSDQAGDVVALVGDTVLTINGDYYDNSDDIEVGLYVQPKEYGGGGSGCYPPNKDGRLQFFFTPSAIIDTNANGRKDRITVTVSIPSSQHLWAPKIGTAEVVVFNRKRNLKSEPESIEVEDV